MPIPPRIAPTKHVQIILDWAPAAIATTPAASQQIEPIAIRVTTALIFDPEDLAAIREE